MNFKEQIRKDLTSVFLNLGEFAELHRIEGKQVAVVIDDDELRELNLSLAVDDLRALQGTWEEASVRENCDQWRAFFGVTETGHASEAAARYILRAMGRPAKE